MRAILLIVPVLLLWLADSPLLTLGALYLAGAAWLAFEYWRAPIVDEAGRYYCSFERKPNIAGEFRRPI